jgi:hypothetical protein
MRLSVLVTHSQKLCQLLARPLRMAVDMSGIGNEDSSGMEPCQAKKQVESEKNFYPKFLKLCEDPPSQLAGDIDGEIDGAVWR